MSERVFIDQDCLIEPRIFSLDIRTDAPVVEDRQFDTWSDREEVAKTKREPAERRCGPAQQSGQLKLGVQLRFGDSEFCGLRDYLSFRSPDIGTPAQKFRWQSDGNFAWRRWDRFDSLQVRKQSPRLLSEQHSKPMSGVGDQRFKLRHYRFGQSELCLGARHIKLGRESRLRSDRGQLAGITLRGDVAARHFQLSLITA